MNAYEMIKNEIIIGKLPPGKRLTEEALAERLQVSRTPIREAIKQLESDGLITPFQRRGYTVREFTIQDIRQIYNVRALLESYGTSEAALYRTDEDLEKIHNKNLAYEKAINELDHEDIYSIRSLQQANQAFHGEIYKATKNEYLMSLISKVVVVPLIFRSFYWYNENQLMRSLDVHNTIWKSIENQEPERAKIAMQEHIYQGRDDVLKQLSNPELEIWKENFQ